MFQSATNPWNIMFLFTKQIQFMKENKLRGVYLVVYWYITEYKNILKAGAST
jgi:hypothetical protein